MQVCQMYLKSNMDRFIVIPSTIQSRTVTHLKSNMDRFIVSECPLAIKIE